MSNTLEVAIVVGVVVVLAVIWAWATTQRRNRPASQTPLPPDSPRAGAPHPEDPDLRHQSTPPH